MQRLFFLLAVLILVGAACSERPEPAPTPSAATATQPHSPTASLTTSRVPPTRTPQPVEGTVTTQVYVRSGPGTGYSPLGLLNSGEKVQILARDGASQWYLILYSSAPQGRGWVAAQYVQAAAGSEIPLDATPTPTGPTGRVAQRLNVRSGPGTTFEALGLLEPNAVVALTGKNGTASWFQIEFPDGPGGHGWVTAQYVQTEDAGGLPVLDDYGNVVSLGATEPAGGPQSTVTATLGPAYTDGDSPDRPAIQVTFSAGGTRQFTYSSQVSSPEGDAEDWVEFTPFAAGEQDARLVIGLACSGGGSLTVELWQGGGLFPAEPAIRCGDEAKLLLLPAGQAYQLRLAAPAQDGPQLVAYQLTVRNEP